MSEYLKGVAVSFLLVSGSFLIGRLDDKPLAWFGFGLCMLVYIGVSSYHKALSK